MNKGIESIFKSYLEPKEVYKGGKNIPVSNKKIYKLSSNENPLGSSPKAVTALQKAAEIVDVYPDQTDIRLREALVNDFDGQLAVDQFICGNSGSEIIDMLLRAFINEGDEVIYSNPCFLPYAVFSRWYGAKQVDVPLLEPNYDLDIEGILSSITGKTKVIFLTSPNNPTGTYIPKPVLEDFLHRIPKNIIVVFDEVYRHFADAEDYVTALPYVREGHNVVAINSFSKTYGLAGQRIGYCYTAATIANYIRQIHKPFLLPITSIEAAIGALNDSLFIEKTVKTVQEGRKYLAETFTSLGIKYWPTQGNFFIIDPSIPEFDFTDKLMREGVMVRPVSQFGAPGLVRITVGTQEANEALVTALKKI
ncbi:aminotransferase class I/II-fold pyridoxal phosphate-dependent enzyme [Flagellimonas sp. HMM57]|uniref:pyridoxal phosphate-dependent aminotransferase n=1 Tax=unclassified Flagellimonas TaxID=2644544 RepID=UPI0013D5A158|nr:MULTISPECIES: histidinol-phosphate transaminase [unclassified Flagellimonas]UII77009.1 aminotransferase class I/II-fold pyridoxal phosphate-dependent enzyme [Flagellimonas sp. HMM57]